MLCFNHACLWLNVALFIVSNAKKSVDHFSDKTGIIAVFSVCVWRYCWCDGGEYDLSIARDMKKPNRFWCNDLHIITIRNENTDYDGFIRHCMCSFFYCSLALNMGMKHFNGLIQCSFFVVVYIFNTSHAIKKIRTTIQHNNENKRRMYKY